MPVPGDRRWYWKAEVVERGHEGEFFLGRKSRHVHPISRVSMTEVIAIGFDGAEGDAAEAVDFQDALLAICTRLLPRRWSFGF